jgi:hypothetical protein
MIKLNMFGMMKFAEPGRLAPQRILFLGLGGSAAQWKLGTPPDQWLVQLVSGVRGYITRCTIYTY